MIYEPMEMEELHARPSARQQLIVDNSGYQHRRSRAIHPIGQLWHMMKLFMELNPITTTILLFVAVGFLLHYVTVAFFRPGVSRHTIKHDYSHIDLDFNFRATKIGSWCLFVSRTRRVAKCIFSFFVGRDSQLLSFFVRIFGFLYS